MRNTTADLVKAQTGARRGTRAKARARSQTTAQGGMRGIPRGALRGAMLLLLAGAAILATTAHAVVIGPGGGGGVTCGSGTGLPGQAGPYSVLIVGSGGFTSLNTDTASNIAAGGDVSLSSFKVAASITGDTTQTPNPARLVVGGQLTASNGRVGSDKYGAIYTNSTPVETSWKALGGVFAQTLIDFNAAATYYQNLSTTLASQASTGTVSVSGNTLTLTGTAADINVFTVDGATLTATNSVNITVPSGSATLINVTGSTATLQNGQVTLTGATPSTVLYNFSQATTLVMPGSKDPQGSILAPYAAVTGSYGQSHGQLVAASYNASIQFEAAPFTCTGLPGS